MLGLRTFAGHAAMHRHDALVGWVELSRNPSLGLMGFAWLAKKCGAAPRVKEAAVARNGDPLHCPQQAKRHERPAAVFLALAAAIQQVDQ
jgi:hypothetical protein